MAQPSQTVDVRDRRVQRQDEDSIGEVITGLAGLLWSGAAGLAALAWWLMAGSVAVVVWVGRQSITGRYRHQIAPAWLALAAGLSGWPGAPSVGWYWLTVACAVEATTWRRRSSVAAPWRVLSRRERRLLACTLAMAAAVLDLAPFVGLSWRWTAGGGCLVILGAAVPWWRGRIGRPGKSEMLARWDAEVAAQDERFAGQWSDFDEDAQTGVLNLTKAPAATVAALDAHAEWLLGEQAGTITITDAPPLTRRQVRVTFSQPGDAARFRFWEGPTLGRDGRFVAAYAAGNVPIYGRLWMPDGASFIAIIAPPGSGKGSIQRLLILETAIHPDIFTIGIDGKRGKGLGYCRAGFDVFAETPKQWATTLDMLIAETERRSALPDGADSFVLRPGLPRTFTAIDDMPEVIAACPAAAKQLNRMTAQDRSLGKGLAVAAQKNDAPSYGGATYGTTSRSNILDNGWLWAGPATDSQAKQALKQSFPFDPGTLPNAKGWAALMGKHLGEQAVTPSRTLWIPNRTDVNEHGMEAPFGTVEDWLERDTVHPVISDEMRSVFFPQAVEVVEATEGDLLEQGDQPVAAFASLPAPVESAGRTRILDVLRANPAGLLRGALAEKAELSPKHTSDLLKDLSRDGKVVQAADRIWRVAS